MLTEPASQRTFPEEICLWLGQAFPLPHSWQTCWLPYPQASGVYQLRRSLLALHFPCVTASRPHLQWYEFRSHHTWGYPSTILMLSRWVAKVAARGSLAVYCTLGNLIGTDRRLYHMTCEARNRESRLHLPYRPRSKIHTIPVRIRIGKEMES